MPISNQKHIPVLVKEVLEYLKPKPDESYLDTTAGYGGHAAEVIELTGAGNKAVLIDRDAEAVDALAKRFKEARVIRSDYLSASGQLLAEGSRFDMIFADLGISSPLLDRAERGFGFSQAGSLDMRMDQRQELTAGQIINQWSEDRLAGMLFELGQEPKARKIARLIVQNRPISTTDQLAKIVARAWPGHSRRHPATRSFQAIRIAVNDELGQLEAALPIWLELLKPGGRLAAISFHSLEDRVVKHFLAEHSGAGYGAQLVVLTPKPIRATQTELAINQRARSASLRAARKINNQKKG